MHGISRDFCPPCSSNHPSTQSAEVGNPHGPVTTSGFEQPCPWCAEPISVGDRIGMRDGEWVCDLCTEAFDDEDDNPPPMRGTA
jgi:hypothetical protein